MSEFPLYRMNRGDDEDKMQERIRELEAEVVTLGDSLFTARDEIARLMLENADLRQQGADLALANAKLCDIMARGIDIARAAEAALAAQRFEIDQLQELAQKAAPSPARQAARAGVLDDTDQSRETDEPLEPVFRPAEADDGLAGCRLPD